MKESILEKQERKLNIQKQLTEIINQAESRSLEDNENAKLVELKSAIDQIDEEIRNLEEENRKIEQKNKENKKENKMEKRVKLFDLIKDVAENNVKDEHRQYINGNTIQYRNAINVGTAGEGQENVPEEKMNLELAIRNASVLDRIGATWFTGVGDFSLPHYGGSNVGWKNEISSADDGAGTFSEIIMKPKRLTAYIDISRTFLAQDSNNAESLLIADLARAIAEKLDLTVFGNQSGTTERPAGLFYDSGYTVTGETALSGVTYDNVLDLETKVELKNGVNYIFVANPKVKGKFKGIDKATGFGTMVWTGNLLDEIPVIVSNSVVDKGLMCVDPKDIAVATWDNMSIQVDTVTRAIYNEIRIVVNYNVDCQLRENKRIACEIFS